ncbi:5-oxoprolinase subunit C family protein [Yoonia sediminilitoris]|uniref:Allophanate hydrolase n=1 Tax=Yoonia sediminilitoris TaxID=1286148 RepID=A0A2T6KFZ3_9RHOB|nr:biotin-dependent carboxyltransferase family protein [Yoonia sediminilitoris]PUB14256.1 allophanate hydrolase [Yoonia sediminilitoris]RCW95187.1 allophanate hydrolase [Yoonia sediminilitoris]
MAKFRITFAGPHVSFQDAGRTGHLRFGVPGSGPMDRLSFAAANTALGNPAGATTIEVSMGGLVLECLEGPISLALAGGDFGAQQGLAWSVFTAQPGEKLTIRPGTSGSWAYLAFAGDVDVPQWLGHTATHALSGLGGGRVRTGDMFDVQNPRVEDARIGDIARPEFDRTDGPMRVVMGPQDQFFQQSALDAFLGETWALTDAYDRMGVRLAGPKLELKDALGIPSEPILRGSVQVAGDGVPTVLLADHGTTGGYPKIAVVAAVDQDRLCQLRAGGTLRFAAISPEEAVKLVRTRDAVMTDYLSAIAIPRGSLQQRLMRENLITGFIED